MPAVSDTEGLVLNHGTRPFAEVAKGYTRFRNGDVIFAKITPCMENGKIAIATDLSNGIACGSTEFHVLRPRPNILPEYLWHFLRQKSFRENAERHMTGAVGQRRVPIRFLQSSMIPLPPIGEQNRIIAKLTVLLGRTKGARNDLDHVAKLVPRYKQAVLASAFSGELIKQNFLVDTKPLSQAVRTLDQGWSPKCEKISSDNPNDWAVIKTTAVQSINFLPGENKVLPASLAPRPRIQIDIGDVLITRAGPRNRVGITCVVKTTRPRLMLADKIYRLKLREHLADPTFITLMLNSPEALRLIEDIKTGTSDSGLNLTQDKFLGLPLPIPSLAAQYETVQRVGIAFRQIDQILVEATKANALLDRLDEAILAKSFRGALLASDSSKYLMVAE